MLPFLVRVWGSCRQRRLLELSTATTTQRPLSENLLSVLKCLDSQHGKHRRIQGDTVSHGMSWEPRSPGLRSLHFYVINLHRGLYYLGQLTFLLMRRVVTFIKQLLLRVCVSALYQFAEDAASGNIPHTPRLKAGPDRTTSDDYY